MGVIIIKVNEFIEIREKKELEEAIEFAWNVTQRDKKVGYPEKIWKHDGLREEFIKAYNHKDDKILVLRSEKDIDGVVCLFVYKENGKINSYILSRVYNDLMGEIFNITTVVPLDNIIIEGLIYIGCKDMFNIGATHILSSCDIGSYERDLYQNVGFERTNDYIGYSIKI